VVPWRFRRTKIAVSPLVRNHAEIVPGIRRSKTWVPLSPVSTIHRLPGRLQESIAMQKISTFLMFDGHVEDAMTFYVPLFPKLEVKSISRYGENDAGPRGQCGTPCPP
jgi:prepilin-type processing-associated H-X9-DG protein